MLSSAPPGMFIAAASVGGSPIARIEYGGESVLASTVSEPGAPVTQVSTAAHHGQIHTGFAALHFHGQDVYVAV